MDNAPVTKKGWFSHLIPNVGTLTRRQRLVRLESNRFFIIGLCMMVGALAGLTSVGMFQCTLFFTRLLHWFRENSSPLAVFLGPAIPGMAIFICLIFGRIFFRKNGYKCALTAVVSTARKRQGFLPLYHTFCHILTCGFSVGCGISAGMEAPSALTGAAVGSNISRWLRLNRESQTLLLCAGSAAGIAAVFNSPLAGVLFACEILLPSVSAVSLIPLLIASASAAIIAYAMGGNTSMPSVPMVWNISQIFYYAILGILAGLVSVYIIRLNVSLHNIFRKMTNVWIRALIGALFLYAFFILFPSLMGQGNNHIQSLFIGKEMGVPIRTLGVLMKIDQKMGFVLAVGLLAFLKPLVSSISLESGGDGGIFGPSLYIGAFFGYFFSAILAEVNIISIPASNCVALGMAGLIAGVMHAPLTGLFLIAELIGSYDMLIPLMVVVALASLVSKVLGKNNIYVSFIVNDSNQKVDEKISDELSQMPVKNFVERDYYPLMPNDSLHHLLQVIVASKKEIFPVLNENNQIMGIVREEHIRPFILNNMIHNQFIVDDFMGEPPAAILENATLNEATRLFDVQHTWILAVIDEQGTFVGFISKASLLSNYRQYVAESELF